MRNLQRNCSKVYFSLYEGEIELLDKDGNKTGSVVPVYGDILECTACVSPSTGSVDMSPFGALEGYDRAITTTDKCCLIDENSRLWLDGQPLDEPHNYVVVRKATSINAIAYAVKRVTVSG